MQECALFSRTCRRFVCTTDSDHDEPIADNLIDRDFSVDAPDKKMVSDTTVIATEQGDLYVAGILDLYGRLPVGLAMSVHNDRFLVMDALKDMLLRGCGSPGCIIHSDRGSTYCSKEYRRMLSRQGFICSMSRKGDCWDNAPMESFWGKMKSEWLKKNTEQSTRQKVIYMNTCGTFILVKGHTNPSIIQHRMIIIIGEKSYRSDSTFMGTLQTIIIHINNTTRSVRCEDFVAGPPQTYYKNPLFPEKCSQAIRPQTKLQKAAGLRSQH